MWSQSLKPHAMISNGSAFINPLMCKGRNPEEIIKK